MRKPSRYFVRVFVPDPDELDADDQKDHDLETLEWAQQICARFLEMGLRAVVMERRNMRPDMFAGFAIFWEYEEHVIS
jgi:hypothetical protein